MSASSHAAPAQDPTLATRYGTGQRRPRRRLGAVVGAIALLAAILGAVAVGLTTSVGRVESKDVGYSVVDDAHMSVTFQAAVPEGRSAECDVKALDQEAGEVGFRTVRLDDLTPVGGGEGVDTTRIYTVDVRTVGRAVTGVVDACRTL